MRMDTSPVGGGPVVSAVGPAGFKVGDARYRALLMTVSDAAEWSPPPLASLKTSDLTAVTRDRPEFILLGTGDTLARPPQALVAALETDGIGIEPMDSRAAARAWAVLRAEGRQIAAALYPLDAASPAR